jgi:hypothetical protein
VIVAFEIKGNRKDVAGALNSRVKGLQETKLVYGKIK